MDDARVVASFFRHLIAMHAVEPHARRVSAIGILVIEGRGIALRVPFLARGHASLAADAGVEVDDEAELLGGGRWQRRHEFNLIEALRYKFGATCLVEQDTLSLEVVYSPKHKHFCLS
jgi:hypothetical protein